MHIRHTSTRIQSAMEKGKQTYFRVIDCAPIGLGVKYGALNDSDIKYIGDQLTEAFTSVGFCYLKNHGVDKSLVKRIMKMSRDFFTMPRSYKETNRQVQGRVTGWLEKEDLADSGHADLKESFNYCRNDQLDGFNWPEGDFKNTFDEMYDTWRALVLRLFDCLSMGLGIEKSYFANAHRSIGNKGNMSTLRTLFYPPISDFNSVEPNQVRLGEHSDYGCISLLFQDDVGGLSNNVPGKGYVPVEPIPDTILVYLGDLMQRWTADKLLAIKHRALIPEEEEKKRQARQSMIFFIASDNDYVIKPLDGSNKYEPTTAKKYLDDKFSANWNANI